MKSSLAFPYSWWKAKQFNHKNNYKAPSYSHSSFRSLFFIAFEKCDEDVLLKIFNLSF